jgi:hypothetical protein
MSWKALARAEKEPQFSSAGAISLHGKSYFPLNTDPIRGSAQGGVPSQLMGRPVEPFFHFFFGFFHFCLFFFSVFFLIE